MPTNTPDTDPRDIRIAELETRLFQVEERLGKAEKDLQGDIGDFIGARQASAVFDTPTAEAMIKRIKAVEHGIDTEEFVAEMKKIFADLKSSKADKS